MGGHGVLYKDATFSNGEAVSKLTLVIYDGFISIEWRAGA